MVKIQAHRGASKERPENTMSAFKHALKLDADGIELDVHMLHDGSLVVHHDAVLGRCENAQGSIYDYTKDNIKSFSVGAKFSKEYKSEVTAFFYEVLDFLKGNDMFLNVEIKAEGGFVSHVGDEVVKLLYDYNMADRCIISSFNHYILKDIKYWHPKYKVGILYGDAGGYDVIAYCKRYKFDAIHPHYNSVNKELVELCHKNNILVNVWTVDLPADISKMIELGADTIITNDVASAKKINQF